jgi:macrophage erythroblast attacher
MDYTVVRPAYEKVVRAFRVRQKATERAVAQVVDAAATDFSGSDVDLAALEASLLEAKASLKAQADNEAEGIRLLDARLVALSDPGRPPLNVNAAIVEHLLRHYPPPAGGGAAAVYDAVLAPRERALVDVDVLTEIAGAEAALRWGDLTPATEWARTWSSRLRRLDSTLEFALARARFVELLRARDEEGAREFAVAQLGPAAKAAAAGAGGGAGGDGGGGSSSSSGAGHTAAAGSCSSGGGAAPQAAATCMRQLQEAMALLAFPDPARSGVPAAALFSATAWGELVAQFRADAYAAAGYRRSSLLQIAVAAGLTAVKTPSCRPDAGVTAEGAPIGSDDEGGAGADAGGGAARPPSRTVLLPSPPSVACACPACHPHYFADALPRAPSCRRSVTRLVDPVTRDVVDEHNVPLVLPNGRVYGAATVEQLLTSADGSQVLCPRTGDVFPRAAVRRAYFV